MKKIEDKETLSDDEMLEIKEALNDVKKGRITSIEQVAKELGIVLNPDKSRK